MPDYANALVKVVAIFDVTYPCAFNYTCTQCFLLLCSWAYLIPSVNVAFRPQSGFKNNCRARTGFGLVISDSDRVQASKWGPFWTLCGYVGRGQQGEIERTAHPTVKICWNPPTLKICWNHFVKYATLVLWQMFLLLVRGYQWRFLYGWGCMHDAQ